nr:MAG TPA: hypothetical protein [Caudoviricetes sp.]
MTRFKKVVRMRKRLQTVLVPYWGEIDADGTISYGYERRFELIEEEEMKKFTKSDLRNEDIVEYRNGCPRTVKGNHLYDEDGFQVNDLDRYDENLKNSSDDLTIVKVYRLIWEREELMITSAEKVLLENISEEYNYIARDSATYLILFESKPIKKEKEWIRQPGTYFTNFYAYMHLFPMVKWEDEEPWLIEDLLKLPVKEGDTK